MERYFLINSEYDNQKSRMILYFSKDPLSKNYEYILREKFQPHLIIKSEYSIIKDLLSDFKKSISVKDLKNNKIKIKTKNYDVLKKIYNILIHSTNEDILLIEPERQFLIQNNWSYYDTFCKFFKNNIKKVNGEDRIHRVVKKYLDNLDFDSRLKLTEPITKRLILSNLLNIKPEINIKNEQILNILFENQFFKNDMIIPKNKNIEYPRNTNNLLESIKIDFNHVWPYLLQQKHYNIGFETLNCNCCKPKDMFDTNILSNSIVEVEFKKNGFYFISDNSTWAYNYHKKNNYKENRIEYKKVNKLKTIPAGPFYKSQIEKIPLSDAIKLYREKEIEINKEYKDQLSWFCNKQKSFIADIIEKLIIKLNNVEKSINMSTTLFYSKTLKTNLEKNSSYLQYLTEYALINDLLEEIPKFIQHKNTKFYNKKLDLAIKSIKIKTIQKINSKQEYRCTFKNEILQTRDKKLVSKINMIFPKMNLPIPKIISR